MFHMLSCFTLSGERDVARFSAALDQLTRHLLARGLVGAVGPLGERRRHPVLDTDSERAHSHYLLLSFNDRGQADRAVAEIQQALEPGATLHHAVQELVSEPVFFCWEDLGPVNLLPANGPPAGHLS